MKAELTPETKQLCNVMFLLDVFQAGLRVFSHFVGCSAESNRPSNVISRLCMELAKENGKLITK